MKPRTKLEKEVTWLSSHLLPPSMEQIEDAQDHMFSKKAYYTKKNGYNCMECGHIFRIPEYADGSETVICPNCHKAIHVERTRKHRETIVKYYMLMQTVSHGDKDFIVQRLFEVRKLMRKDKAASYGWIDIAEYYTIEGCQVCLGIPLGMFGKWNYRVDMSIKRPQKYASYYGGSYDSYIFTPDYLYSESVAPILFRNGFNGDYENYYPQCFVRNLMCEPSFEKLYKLGGGRLIGFYGRNILEQTKIVNRHHYRISDPSIWIDTISLLRKLNMDDRNPKHICPDDLHRFHNDLLSKWTRLLNKEAAERRQREQMIKREEELKRIEREKVICEEYVQRIARFLNLNIQDELISITPIPTVEAVHEEGNAMKHCVFAMGYYKRPEVLLLSARDKAGNRIETIEVNLNTYKVAQSRGVCNSNTEHHERILSMMEHGMPQIKQMNKIKIKAA